MNTVSEITPLFGTLSQTLWRQHRLLELLLYRMEVQRLMLATGQGRWIEQAASDVEAMMDVLREEELVRATQVARLAERLGIDRNASLRELVEASPEPWSEILRDHQRAFLELVDQIDATSKANRDLIRRSLRLTRELLGVPAESGTSGVYDRSGALPSGRTDPVLLDRDA
ncbi:MAG TPA: flagellar protein FlgN [Acidimicrobiales bacterium]